MMPPTLHRFIITACFLVVYVLSPNKSYAQTFPPAPFTIYANPAQGLFFGAFFTGNLGGTVIIYPDGTRSVTGDVIQASLGHPFSAAIFEVEAQVGTRVGIINGPNITLTGSNGGTMTLTLGSSSPASPFVCTVAPPSRTQVSIGGTLTVGNIFANPVGSYSGIFSVTFVQE
ncbi:hypothetical protein CAP35_08810 [Chitinophagaceae bacterium IBVUCB1]|jgi:hypothetical protein|nr:hypothetical protein CAP35_08810 [Chitinophagaceae bacterium IBVUCB1]